MTQIAQKTSTHKKLVRRTLTAFVISSAATHASAEVTSLSSSELTETYIEDSTVIITPKQQSALSQQKTVSSLTIAPVEKTEQDMIELENADIHQESTTTLFELTENDLRQASVDTAINPLPTLDIPTYQEITTRPVADILNDERYRAPEGDFTNSYIGDDLGLSRTGDQLTFSIGNLPGIDQIDLPYGIDEGPLTITPREGGGFDLTINVPQD